MAQAPAMKSVTDGIHCQKPPRRRRHWRHSGRGGKLKTADWRIAHAPPSIRNGTAVVGRDAGQMRGNSQPEAIEDFLGRRGMSIRKL